MGDNERLKSLFQLCRLFIRSGKLNKAEIIYNLCIKEFGNDFRCYFNYAQLRCLQKRYKEALSLFYEAEIRCAACFFSHLLVLDFIIIIILLFISNRNKDEIIVVTALSGLLLKLGEPQKALVYCRKVSNLTYDCEKKESFVKFQCCIDQPACLL
jgi:tetratricopeptide (TPR) repeat protein